LIKNYVNITKTDLLANKKTLNLNKNVTPILDITEKKVTIDLFDNYTATTYTIPAKKNLYITYAWIANSTPYNPTAFITLTQDNKTIKILGVNCPAQTLTDSVNGNISLNYNPPILCKPGAVIQLGGEFSGFGGYYEDIY